WCARNGRYPEAEQLFLRSIELNPDFPLHYYELGEVELKLGRPERAVTALRRTVEMVPENLHFRLRYATSLQLAGDLEGALGQLRYVLERMPDEPILRLQVARLEDAVARSDHSRQPAATR